jgi:hypothetical protein
MYTILFLVSFSNIDILRKFINPLGSLLITNVTIAYYSSKIVLTLFIKFKNELQSAP